MDESTFTTLELDGLLQLLVRHVQTPIGRDRVLGLRPAIDLERIQAELHRTTECVEYLKSGQRFGFSGIGDPAPSFALLEVEGTRLDPHQILSLERIVAVGIDLRNEFRHSEVRSRVPALSALVSPIPDLRGVQSQLQGKLLPNGEIDDRASPELRRIRREIQERRDRIHRQLESVLRDQERAAQEELVTFRNGRFVIPLRTDARGRVPGVVHGLSSSGQTTYVEPLAVIEQNNEWVRVRELEQIEIARILQELTDALREQLPGLRSVVGAISELDLAQAKALLSDEFTCVCPRMHHGAELSLLDARHLLLEASLRTSGARVVPVSFSLDPAHQVLVISGPNAGGKTVVLKTAGSIVLMAQMGLHVPAREAVLPVYRQLFADIGDQQSIAANLSTFTAHLGNINEMASRLQPPALLLLDEVGTGTDPDEGAALAVAIVDYFRRARVTAIATTHYNELKEWASEAEGVVNASVEFDTESLRPTYRLIAGVAGASCGLDIAERLQIPREIIQAARGRLDPAQIRTTGYLKRLKSAVDQQEIHLAALEEERRATAEKFASLERSFADKEASRRARFEQALEQALREFREECGRVVATVKDRVEAARLKKQTDARAAALRRTAAALVDRSSPGRSVASTSPTHSGLGKPRPSSREIQKGDRVRVAVLDQTGTVESIQAGMYAVQVGSLRYRARREELDLLETTQPAARRPDLLPSSPEDGAFLDQEAPRELNIIGLTTDEATVRVDKFLDTAFLSGVENVRIVHGHGTGALRRAVARLLDGHPQVESFRPAPQNQGGSGATIVELRK